MADDSGFDDEEMKLAMALSLQQSGVPRKQVTEAISSDVVRLDGSEHANTSPSPYGGNVSKTRTASLGLAGLDRKAMELERLERLSKKRKLQEVDISPPPVHRKQTIASNTLAQADGWKTGQASQSDEASQPVLRSQPRTSESTGSVKPTMRYPRATVKKTWCFGAPRLGDDIKIEELLQAKDLQLAVLSSFQWDMDWLIPKLDLPRTKLVFVMQAKEEETKQQWRNDIAHWPNVRLCFPPMPGNVFCMHSKLMLLGYKDFLRIAVPTANLTQHDWGESGILENSVFIIDLPRLSEESSIEEELGEFGRELTHFCRAMGLDDKIVASLLDFDFSETEGLAFVHTIGGDHADGDGKEPWRRTGYCGLGRAVTNLRLDTKERINMDFIASSIGSISKDFLSTLYLACQGNNGMTELDWRTNASNIRDHAEKKARGQVAARSKPAEPDRSGKDGLLAGFDDDLSIFFPSRDTVAESRGGFRAGGVIFLKSDYYNSTKFPRQCFRDCRSTRRGVLMHNKIIYVRPKEETTKQSERAWAYIGSANCSESAWGRLIFDKSKKRIKMNCRNWECGVVVPVKYYHGDDKTAQGQDGAEAGSPPAGLDIFRGVVPVPMEYPGTSMAGKRPWHNDQAS